MEREIVWHTSHETLQTNICACLCRFVRNTFLLLSKTSGLVEMVNFPFLKMYRKRFYNDLSFLIVFASQMKDTYILPEKEYAAADRSCILLTGVPQLLDRRTSIWGCFQQGKSEKMHRDILLPVKRSGVHFPVVNYSQFYAQKFHYFYYTRRNFMLKVSLTGPFYFLPP